jgi:hypothetical protein
MGMVNSHQLLAAIAHRSLRRKQIFGSGFVRHQRIGRDIPQGIDCLGIRRIAAYQAAAFVGGFTKSVIQNLVNMGLLNRKRHDLQERSCGSAT